MTNIAKLPNRETTVGYVAGEIRAHAARVGLSGRQLAARMGRSQPWMSRRLTGEVPFDVQDLDDVAAVLGINPRVLFPGNDEDPRQGGGGLVLSDAEQRVVMALRSSLPGLDSNQEPIG
ncbi:helix-turn-helix domain-containing protein [Microbacterium sp.]|uniref:helix-turn-helix domain-containing protein n=1 Tax=Microbacterium sp. TaxID=51671 RepID=UPI0039E30325